MLKKSLIVLLPTLLLFLAIGCSDNSVETVLTTTGTNLEDEFGGYNATAEQIGFGDSELLAAAAEEEVYDDPIMTASVVDSILADPDAGFYRFCAVWGMLEFDSTVTNVTDWTGSLTITRGAEVVRRLIRFEPGQDYLVERTDRQLVEWVSKTTVHNDGIVVDLIIPPVRPVFDTTITIVVDSLGDTTEVAVVDTVMPIMEPVSVSFTTGPYSQQFSLTDIAALDTIVTLADGNAVALHGLRMDGYPCPRGLVSGRWGVDENGQGVFRGVWHSRAGTIRGFLQGHYGTNDAGKRVFFGKWISETGKFEGFLKGNWRPHAVNNMSEHAMRPGGFFEGGVYDASRAEIGRLRGQYRAAPQGPGGFFQGRWKLSCPQISLDGNERSESGF
ncbi:MAG: hypothetical protein P1R58_01340 [bacterium]|nr:hypothetical protein [bacterium]